MSFTHNSKTSENEPAWANVVKENLPRVAFADQGEADKKSTWKYPHHWIADGGGKDENGVYTTGTMYLHAEGLNAAWSAANGGRSGEEASAEVKSHLQAHRKALGLDEPEKKESAGSDGTNGTDRTNKSHDSHNSHWQRVQALHALQAGDSQRKIGVDRDKEIIHGVILAQAGPFKSEGRGEFDAASLETILRLAGEAPGGLKSRLSHPDESHDGIGDLLGRVKDPWPDTIGERQSRGQLKQDPVACVRGDLHLNPAAHKGDFDMAEWLMTACETDPDAISASLVLKTDEEYRLNPDGTPQRDTDGECLPPLWRPLELHALDIVDTGDAVDGLLSKSLSPEQLPNGILWRAEKLLNDHFAGKSREFVSDHLRAYLDRYLTRRYGPDKSHQSHNSHGKDGTNRTKATNDMPHDMPGGMPEHTPDSMPGGNEPDPRADDSEPLHDGCRSTLAYHHVTMCRQCETVMSSCGCDHRDRESRVIHMSKDPCMACQKAAAGDGDNPPDNPAGPNDREDDTPPEVKETAADRRRRRMFALTQLSVDS